MAFGLRGRVYARGTPAHTNGKAKVKSVYNISMTKLTEDETSRWEELKRRAYLSLNDGLAESLRLREQAALKKLQRAGYGENELPYDRNLVIRFLLEYSNQVSYRTASERAKIGLKDLQFAFTLWGEGKMICDYVRYVNHELRKVENDDLVEDARRGLKKKLTDGKCKLDGKSIAFTLERLDKESFGDPRINAIETEKKPGSGNGGGGILIQVVSDAAKLCEKPPEEPKKLQSAAVFIDV